MEIFGIVHESTNSLVLLIALKLVHFVDKCTQAIRRHLSTKATYWPHNCSSGCISPELQLQVVIYHPASLWWTFLPSEGTSPLPVVKGEPEKVDKERAKELLSLEDFKVLVDLGMCGDGDWTWCDYRHNKEHGDYRSLMVCLCITWIIFYERAECTFYFAAELKIELTWTCMQTWI